jgi:ribosome-associated protein
MSAGVPSKPRPPVRRVLRVPEGEFTLEYVRSSGPGGQNVNKTATKAVLRWSVVDSASVPADVKARFLARWASRITLRGEVIVASDRYRDQPRNTADCVAKLDAMVQAVAVAPRVRRPTRPGPAAQDRRVRVKKRRARVKTLRGRVAGEGD